MERFDRSRGRSKDRSSDGDNRGRTRFKDDSRGRDNRDSDRKFNRYSRDRSDLKLTKVICSACGVECEVPFKPSSNKPVYCSDCFVKGNKSTSSRSSNQDLEIINEKLDKIMKALDI